MSTMSKNNGKSQRLLPLVAFLLLGFTLEIDGKILAKCDSVKELQRGGISRTMISNWICLMQNESGMNTRLITGPKTSASYSFGIFQINSQKWCKRGRKGGLCDKRCEDFADDDIQDDIVCAHKIYTMSGWKEWGGWLNKCKGKPLPDIAQCKRRRR